MAMVSSNDGSGTYTGWKRLSKAGSFSIYFLYSSMVVAPMTCKSPRAKAGFSIFDAFYCAFCTASANYGVNFIYEEYDFVLLLDYLIKYFLHSFLEFATVLSTSHQRTDIQLDYSFTF